MFLATALPVNARKFSLLTTPEGNGVLAIQDKDIYKLVCQASGCSWKVLEQKLMFEREDYIAMLIPDELTSCTSNKY